MAKFLKVKKALLVVGFLFLAGFAHKAFLATPEREYLAGTGNASRTVAVNDNGLSFTSATTADTVADFLQEAGLEIDGHDKLVPDGSAPIHPGMRIAIDRAVFLKIQVDGETIEKHSTAKTIGSVLDENGIILGKLDKVSPDIDARPQPDGTITVTRIDIEEKTVAEDIDFKTVTDTDSKMGWREEKITQKGAKGVKEVTYKITYKNDKEISRVILEKKITQEPVTQITTKGTRMELGKAAKGQGTWYAFKGGMFAASTTIPKGEYAKVTNTANGKSIVVQINDYGPQGKGRIIDLDKVAFAKIASLGAGVIGVKVERILN